MRHEITYKKKSRGPHRDPLWIASCVCGLSSMPKERHEAEDFARKHLGHHLGLHAATVTAITPPISQKTQQQNGA